MQLGLPFGATDAAVSPQSSPEYYFVRHRRARRYVLRVDFDGRVRVTIPRGGSRREADAFAERQVEWIRRQQARRRPSIFSAEDVRCLRQRARSTLPPRLL